MHMRTAVGSIIISSLMLGCSRDLTRDEAAALLTSGGNVACPLNATLTGKPEFAALLNTSLCDATVAIGGISQESNEALVEYTVTTTYKSAELTRWIDAMAQLKARLTKLDPEEWLGSMRYVDPADGQAFGGQSCYGRLDYTPCRRIPGKNNFPFDAAEPITTSRSWAELIQLEQQVRGLVSSGPRAGGPLQARLRRYDDGWRLVH